MRHAILFLWLAAGCAVGDAANRRTLNAMDAHLAPESIAARVALAPMALPAGTLALAADAVVVHPCCVLDDAWGDTSELLWRPRQESRFRRAVMLPVRALVTPIVFAADWLGRSVFAIPPRREDYDA